MDFLVSLKKVFLNETHITLAAMVGLLTCVNEDVPLQMVVGSECSIAVNTDVALGVLQAQRSIIIVNAENLSG